MTDAPVNQLTNLPIPSDKLEEITRLAREQYLLEMQVSRLEGELEEKKDQLKTYRDQRLPEAMIGCGLTMFKLSDGYKVEVKPFVNASIPSYTACAKDPSLLDIRDRAYQWLRDHNFGSLIKREIALIFGKGEDKKADQIKAALMKKGLIPIDTQTVHPQTLKSFVREQLEAGKDLPRDLLGVHVGNRAEITPSKT